MGADVPATDFRAVMASPCIGIDLGGTKIELAMVDADGAIVQSARRSTHADRGAHRVVEALMQGIENDLDGAWDRAEAIGIGVAGQVDAEAGRVRTSPHLGWTDVPLQARMEEALDRPVTVANDVHAIVRGVRRYGAGRGVDDLVVVFVGTGIGGAVVNNGTIIQGHRGSAGELGHMPIVAQGRSCHCPNKGCWEAYAGGWAIAERARAAVRADRDAGQALLDRAGRLDAITGRTVHTAADDGDALATELVDETGRYLGSGMTGVVNAFNPERIVLGGGVIEGHPGYVEQVRRIVDEQALQVATESLTIVLPTLDGPGVIGAAAMARDRLERNVSSPNSETSDL